MVYLRKQSEFSSKHYANTSQDFTTISKVNFSYDYLQDNFDLTEKDKEKTRGKIKEMSKELYLLKSAFESHDQVKHYETFKTLGQVFDQQCEIKPKSVPSADNTETGKEAVEVSPNFDIQSESGASRNDDLPEISIREKSKGDKIISTPHNTDAVYPRKRKQTVVGHKEFVTETCDTDNVVQFITDVNLETATHSDAKEISKIE